MDIAEEDTVALKEEIIVCLSMTYGIPIEAAELLFLSYYSKLDLGVRDEHLHLEMPENIVWEVHASEIDGLGRHDLSLARLDWFQAGRPLPNKLDELSKSDRLLTLNRRDAVLRTKRGLGNGWLPAI